MYPHDPIEMEGIEEMEKNKTALVGYAGEPLKRVKVPPKMPWEVAGWHKNHCAACMEQINSHHSVTFGVRGVFLCYDCFMDFTEVGTGCSCEVCKKMVPYNEGYVYQYGKSEVYLCKECFNGLVDGPGCEGQTRPDDCAYCEGECMNRSMPFSGRKVREPSKYQKRSHN